MRKYLIVILSAIVTATIALGLFTIFETKAEAAEFQKFNGVPVLDQAEILSPKKEEELNKQLSDFQKKTDRQVVVATIESLDGQEIQPYATEYFRFLGVGSKELNDGVLFLVAPNDRKMRIEVGYGLEASLTDANSGRILADLKPFFREKNYDGGIQQGVDQILPLVTPEAIEQALAAKIKADAAAKETSEAFANFFISIFAIAAGVGGLIGGWWLITLPSRRRKANDEAELAKQAQKQREAEQAAAYEADRKWRIEENRKAIARALKKQADEKKKEREWQEYLKNETPAQKRDRLAREEIERQNKAEAARIAQAAAIAAAERTAAQQKLDEERRRKEARRSNYDDDYYSRSSSSSDWGSSSSDYGSSSSSSDFGGGSSGGGGADSSW